MTEAGILANALRDVFSSPNTLDSNHEPANVVDVLGGLARALDLLGNNGAVTASGREMGGMEALGKAMLDSSSRIADAISDLADAIRETRR